MKKRSIAIACAVLGAGLSGVHGQTRIDLPTQGRSIDFTNAPMTKPFKAGVSLPAQCGVGETFFLSTAPAGKNLYLCTAADTWTLQAAASVLTVFGRTGAVVPQSGDYSASQVTNAVDKTAANTYTAGATQTFAAGATMSGIHLTPAALPSAPQSGDLAVDSGDANKLKFYDGSAWVAAAGSPLAGTNYGVAFSGQTTVAIAAAAHGFTHSNLMVACYDASTPANQIEPDSITVHPTTYDVTVRFTNTQSGYCVVNGSGGGGGGAAVSGASMAAQLGDLAAVRTAAQTIQIGGNCSTATPCRVRFGSTIYSFTQAATVTVGGTAAGSGTVYLYVTRSGVLTAGYTVPAGDTVNCGNCATQSAIASFPPDAIPVASWTATWASGTGSFDALGGSDQRAILSTGKSILPGVGLVTADLGASTGLSLDTSVIGLRVGVPASATSTCDSGSWAADGSFLFICFQTNTWRRVAITSW